MAFGERIRVVIDVAADKAVSSLRSFRTELNNADTAVGKMKVAGGAAFGAVKAQATEMAFAAGAALVGFAVKGVKAFQDLALESGKFSDATGIAVEDASRWIEVAGDFGVSADSVQSSIMRMNKAIADGKLGEFEAQIVRASDGTINANATFQNLITTIGGIEDPTKRALAAQTAFGRGYGEMAELMSMSAEDLASALGSVSDAKVIDDKELRKARDFRAAMDELGDKVGDAALAVGENLVPKLLQLIEIGEQLTGLVKPILGAGEASADVADDVAKLESEYNSLYETLSAGSPGVQALIEYLQRAGVVARDTSDATGDLIGSIDAADRMYNEFAEGMKKANSNVIDFAAETADAEDAVDDLTSAVDDLRDALSDKDAIDDMVEAQQEFVWYSAEAARVLASESSSLEEKAAAQATADEAMRRSIDTTIDYLETTGGIPRNIATLVETHTNNGQLAEAERLLSDLARDRNSVLNVSIRTSGKFLSPEGKKGPGRAAGGPTSPNTLHEVTEGGKPELLDVGGRTYLMMGNQGGMVRPAATGAGATSPAGVTNHITINMPAGSNGEDVVRALRQWQRVNGAIPITTR